MTDNFLAIEGFKFTPFVPDPTEFYSGVVTITNLDAAAVPLPAGMPLLLAGLGGLALLRRRNAARSH